MTSVEIYNRQKAREQFQEKMVTLNKGFLKAVEAWISTCPHYDLTPTVKSYLQHVKELDTTYCQSEDEPKKTGNRVIAKAKRRIDKSATNSPQFNVSKQLTVGAACSTPFINAPPFRVSDVSHIAPNDSLIGTPESTTTSRKRAIRGGGPLGEPESVVFREKDSTINSSTTGSSKISVGAPSFANAGPDFWGFGKKVNEPLNTGAESTSKNGFESEKSSFSTKNNDVDIDNGAKSKEQPFAGSNIFGKSSLTTSSTFSKITDLKEGSAPKANFPNFFNNLTSPPIKFGGTEKTEPFATSGSVATEMPKFIFGSIGNKDVPKPFGSLESTNQSKLIFGSTGSSNTQPESQEDGEEGEYVPPKADIVEGDEPDAFLSVKCSAFKMIDKQYTKLGVGMLHLKEKDGKKSLLLRAATTVGTIWLNALINKTMKVSKVEDTKLRVLCPTGNNEIAIHLFRFVSAQESDRVLKAIEKGKE